MAAALPQQAVMGAYIAVSALELFIQKQVVTFDGSALPALSGGFTFVPRQGVRFSTPVLPRFLQQQQQPLRKHQRTSQHVSAVGSNVALAALARPPTLRPAHAVRVLCNTNKPCRGPPPIYICVSDFVTKLDATQYPKLGGCTISACPGRASYFHRTYEMYQSNCYGCLSSRPQLGRHATSLRHFMRYF